jgi:hypothetical protein
VTECIPHPEDPSRWLPVEEAIGTLWRDNLAALALIEGHDARLAAQRSVLSDLTARVEKVETLTARVDSLEAANATLTTTAAGLRKDVDALAARVKALEPLSGPAFGPDMSGWQTVEQVAAAAADPDVDFIILKATEGMSGRNSLYPAQRAAAGDKFLGAYHFAWPSQDPAKEAANFLEYAALKVGEVAFYDGEDWGETDSTKPNYARDKAMRDATPWSQRVGFQLEWLRIVKARPLVARSYHNWSWIKGLRGGATLAQWDALTSDWLWLAEPTGTPGQHSTVMAKDGSNDDDWPIVLHQYATKPYDLNWTPDIAALRAAK